MLWIETSPALIFFFFLDNLFNSDPRHNMELHYDFKEIVHSKIIFFGVTVEGEKMFNVAKISHKSVL